MLAHSDIALLHVGGDLDVSSIDPLRSALDRLISEGYLRIVIDMSKVSYIDSAGIGLFLSRIKKMRYRGGLLSMTHVSSLVMRALECVRLVDLIPVCPEKSLKVIGTQQLRSQLLWSKTLMCDPAQMQRTRARINQLLSELQLSEDERFDLILATGEALGNAVDHTTAEAIRLNACCYTDRVVMEITDCGLGFDPEASTDKEASLTEQEAFAYAERGRGIKLMRMLVDDVIIEKRPQDRGTMVRLVKEFRPASN